MEKHLENTADFQFFIGSATMSGFYLFVYLMDKFTEINFLNYMSIMMMIYFIVSIIGLFIHKND